MGKLINFPNDLEIIKTKLIHDDGKYALGLGKNETGDDILVIVGRGKVSTPLYLNLTQDVGVEIS